MTSSPCTRGAIAVAWCLIACGVPRPAARPEAIFGRAGDAATARAAVLVAHLTLAEKVGQLQNAAPAIPRLGIPAYDWWSESLHGVARAGLATVFPQAIALAATFDDDLVRRVGEAIAEEARAKFAARRGAGADAGSGQYHGLSFFAPNINIFRDPRWGRGQETFGEDPFLTARMAVAYVRGLQGDDPRRLKVAAVAKHFAVHSGPEQSRHGFDARVDAHDLADTYLPQFEAVVREGRVAGIMAAYNRINGTPCVTDAGLLGDRLRGKWGFEGFVVGDCGAIEDVYRGHHGAGDGTRAAAAALRAGTDLDCGTTYRHLAEAVRFGAVGEAELDRALIRLFAVRFRLALFDGGPSRAASPSTAVDPAVNPTTAPDVGAVVDGHRALAREAARRSIVLLRNDGVLPLGSGVRRLAVLGPTGDDLLVLLGNYHGTPRAPVTLRAGLEAAARARGIDMTFLPAIGLDGHRGANLAAAEAMARQADVVVLCLGISPRLESEEGDPESENPRGDRQELGLPGLQPLLLRRLLAIGKPVVVVLTGGSAVVLPADANPGAVLMVWYPGEEGGNAVADVLFGAESPSGRLPVTFYRDARDLPPFADYGMRGRTYRYFAGQVAYPFGHGLGYAEVMERDVTATTEGPGAPVRVAVKLDNRGPRTIERTVLVYAELAARVPSDPLRSLVAFRRVTAPGGTVTPLTFELAAAAFQRVDAAGVRRPVPGLWRLRVGDAPPVAVEIPAISML